MVPAAPTSTSCVATNEACLGAGGSQESTLLVTRAKHGSCAETNTPHGWAARPRVGPAFEDMAQAVQALMELYYTLVYDVATNERKENVPSFVVSLRVAGVSPRARRCLHREGPWTRQ